MGIKSTENPYAKDDPNNKVDYVHSDGSYHYQNFGGEPKVGKGVDFNADGDEKEKLKKFIEWIRKTYDKRYNFTSIEDDESHFDFTKLPVDPRTPEEIEKNEMELRNRLIGPGPCQVNEEINRIKMQQPYQSRKTVGVSPKRASPS